VTSTRTWSWLSWIERALIAVGIAAGIWCARILVEAQRTKSLPIEPVRVTMSLPGDAANPPAKSPDRNAPAVGTVIGRFEIPALQVSTPVLEGTDDQTLSRGSGHIEDTPFPGEPGNVGIAGHRDTVFRPLKRIKTGDEMVVTTADRVYRYRVTRTLIVDPEDVYVLDPTKEPTLTLVTCYPFEYVGHAPRRFIVQAQLVAP
jgi:sortase A